MTERQLPYRTILRHAAIWLLYFFLMAWMASNDGHENFGFSDLHGKKVLLQLLFFPGHALVCYGIIFGVLPGLFRNGLIWKSLLVTGLLFAVSYAEQYYFIRLFRPFLNDPWPNVPGPSKYGLFIFRHTFFYPMIFYFILIADVMVGHWLKKEKRKQQLEGHNLQVELAVLKAQVHPHFLFNTLNNIYAYSITKPREGAALGERFYGLLEYMFSYGAEPFVLLDKEIGFIADYLELEKTRYGDRLTVEFDNRATGTGLYIAPLMLIQLVENSFKHGASKRLGPSRIKMECRTEDGNFLFSIANDKPEKQVPDTDIGNLGLSNVKNRLHLIYPGSHLLEVRETDNRFFVSLRIPLRKQPF